MRYVAEIRTDLDRFSEYEISALVYHGYTLIDHCLNAYHPEWIINRATPLMFTLEGVDATKANWDNLSNEELAKRVRHFLDPAIDSGLVDLYIGPLSISSMIMLEDERMKQAHRQTL